MRYVTRARSIVVFVVLGAPFAPFGWCTEGENRQAIRLDVTRDAWVSEVGREADGNNGGAPRLKLKSIQEMSLLDIDAETAPGPDDPVGRAPLEESRRRAAQAGDGQQRRGRVVRGDRERLCDPARRRDVSPSPAPRPALVDRRRRPLPRCPGQRRHDPGGWPTRRRPIADGWQQRAGRPTDRGGPRGRAQPWLPRLRRHRLGMDPRGRDVHLPALPQSIRLQPGPEPRRAPRISRSSSGPRIASRRRPRRPAGRAGDGALAGRRGAGLVGHAPR